MWPGAYPQTSVPSSNETGAPGNLYTVSVVPQLQGAQVYNAQQIQAQAQAQVQGVNGDSLSAVKLQYEQGQNLTSSSVASSGYPQKGQNLQNLGTTTRVIGTVRGNSSEGQNQQNVVHQPQSQPQLIYGKQYYAQPNLNTQFQGFSTTNPNANTTNSYITKQHQQHMYGVAIQGQVPGATGAYYNVMPMQAAQQPQHPHSGIVSTQGQISIPMYAHTQQEHIPTTIVQHSMQSTDALSPSHSPHGMVAHIPAHLMAPYKNVVEEKIEKTIDTFGSRRPKRARRRRYGMTTGYGKAGENHMAYIPVNPAHLMGQTQVQLAQTKQIKKSTPKSPKNKSKVKEEILSEKSQTKTEKYSTSNNKEQQSTNSSSKDCKEVSTSDNTSATDTTTTVEKTEDKDKDKDKQSTEKTDGNGIFMSKRKRVPETTSKYRGVSWNKANKSWKACIKIKGRNIHIGYFGVETDAAKAYDIVSQQYRGARARVNFPESRAAYAQTVGYYC